MKTNAIILAGMVAGMISCAELDLNPLSEGSSEAWYSNETEVEMSVNDLFREVFWPGYSDSWTDDFTNREALTPVTNATINGEWGTVNSIWSNTYKVIARSNTLLLNMEKIQNTVPEQTINTFTGNAHFVRAAKYADLVFLYGDVVYSTTILDLEEAFSMERTDKNTVKEAIYEDFDRAANLLPESYGSSENKLATKGAAYAFKARFALQMGDFAVARDAAKACMDLGIYELYPNYSELFLTSTRNPQEVIFAMPRSRALNVTWGVRNYLPRNAGGWGGAVAPSWDLFHAFLCTDGLPIDESPLYDPQNPFDNRDPRCAATIVPFQSRHLNFIYQPHPDSTEVMNFNTGNMQTNNDTRSVAQFASFNGLLYNKGVDEEWLPNFQAENDQILMRFADVLLMYAEAKIELGGIDPTVHEAMNAVRARAYGVAPEQTDAYPAITQTDQASLRTVLRTERRMEFGFEGIRYSDIIRWKIAEKVLNRDIYGMLDVAELKEKVVDQGLWFFPMTPEIDEDGVADLSPMFEAGLVKRLAIRRFEAPKQYLWPIPSKEILINANLDQNPGY
ncbi:RagB/SusD family nutrient uptake outer membrane protein [Cyclobacterium jeungdonense]|uniref:RagB/SusD family nutrient uptake outer membrane protein n=1 Tax=Cyclobacterium jeungdonense TaxID=708087 RepID=A0ABT8C0P1_9BACT|nr:RagB/SusD family nutrient uptake outer membrane protein [Cyclobacterium jeungdonense]MDN3686363.1 RagB/SusD family nutrient uptake outer membrane protein [Cyclobacterium jeungdonense]